MIATRKTRTRRRGALGAMELLLILPILVLLLLAVVELAMVLSAKSRLAQASREAARVAALRGSHEEIERSAKALLKGAAKEHAKIVVTPDHESAHHGTPIRVEVSVNAKYTAPDLLRIVGISLERINLSEETTMRVE